MNLEFSDSLPDNYLDKVPCISGKLSWNYGLVKYILQKEDGIEGYKRVFEIRYEYHCSPFKQVEIHNSLLAVGYEGFFYLFDHIKNKNLAALEVYGYFSSFQIENDGIYICDAGSVWRIDFDGNIIWRNKNLGIDGVIISEFQNERIIGSGEWDPPGGWRDFILDRKNGIRL